MGGPPGVHQNGYGAAVRLRGVRRAWLLLLLLPGCAEPSSPTPAEADPLAALGLVPATAPFALDGWTLCLPSEGGDDVTCDVPGGSRVLLGPYDAVITAVDVTVSWTPASPATQQLVVTVACHESGATDNPVRCEGVDDAGQSGASPLTIRLGGLQTAPTALIEVRVEEPELAAGAPSRTRQAFHVEGTVFYAPDPDATNQG